MSRTFVSRFLLPLVEGGKLHVGRPLGARAVESLVADWSAGNAGQDETERQAGEVLGRQRQTRARTFLLEARPPSLDEDAFRLGAAVHNLLSLSHPGFAGVGKERWRERIARATEALADLAPPRTADEAVSRHSLLSRLPEITLAQDVVDYWLGRQVFLGRTPPSRMLRWPKWRRVKRTSTVRSWMKEIGVVPLGRPAWLALHRASPLGEALDPLRLDPPWAWERVLPILRFAPLARLVAGRVVEVGIGGTGSAGAAIAEALFRFASVRPPTGEPAAPRDVALALRFLAHAMWLDHLFGAVGAAGPGHELAALVVAAHDVDPGLVWPQDMGRQTEVGRSFSNRMQTIRRDLLTTAPERYAAARSLCRVAARRPATAAGDIAMR